jgi:hypothetical protein
MSIGARRERRGRRLSPASCGRAPGADCRLLRVGGHRGPIAVCFVWEATGGRCGRRPVSRHTSRRPPACATAWIGDHPLLRLAPSVGQATGTAEHTAQSRGAIEAVSSTAGEATLPSVQATGGPQGQHLARHGAGPTPHLSATAMRLSAGPATRGAYVGCLPLSPSSSFRDCGQTAPRGRRSKRSDFESPCGWSRVGFDMRCRNAPLPDSPPSTPTPTAGVPSAGDATAGGRDEATLCQPQRTPTIPLDGTTHP